VEEVQAMERKRLEMFDALKRYGKPVHVVPASFTHLVELDDALQAGLEEGVV
jgi:hypothetical protein